MAHELAELIPHARLELLAGAASAPFVDGADDVIRTIDEFLVAAIA